MKIIAVIPARYAATRFPGKLMQTLGHQTIIAHTYQNTVATELFDEVLVATDSEIIENEIRSLGGKVFRSLQEHESGTDRIAEAIRTTEADVIINVQGDEPFVKKEALEVLCGLFKDPSVQVGSLMHLIHDADQINDPNCVKVVVSGEGNALYFSRSVIPYHRDTAIQPKYYKHIGIYGYRKQALLNFTQMPPSLLEQSEKLEQLRLLENGVSIRMGLTEAWSVSIDTPADLERAKTFLKQ